MGKSLYLSDPQFPHQSNWVMLPSPWGCVRVAVMVGKVPAEPCMSVAGPPPIHNPVQEAGCPHKGSLEGAGPIRLLSVSVSQVGISGGGCRDWRGQSERRCLLQPWTARARGMMGT